MQYNNRNKNPGPGYGFLTGNALKGIGAVTMVIDHFGAVVMKGYVNSHFSFMTQTQIDQWSGIYRWLRNIGRTSFPIFAFLLAEGFFYTENRKRYGLRLLLFALLSEIPYDLAFYGRLWDLERQNILFTLFLGLMLMELAEQAGSGMVPGETKGRKRVLPDSVRFLLQCMIFAAGAGLSYLCRLDYSYKGIALMAVFFFFHAYRGSAAVAGACLFSGQPWSLPAFLLIWFYNGKRGGKRTHERQHWFYLFYPVHLLVLAGMLWIVDKYVIIMVF